ncbi:hypothetical protein Y919_09950 [Caloranaerobacter azorensis H53214]|uniref:Uncharacterized protein n=1 Tax=Caloranaerobacter azorensis H53214 TaxID=1156417 RepID=A0A096CTA6_9FIRM|nr:hypothetical protein [Caloranaerobacter azorensis]KGG79784.1 hypothetical protein Y919_09950 [Caloranaerobacter azorensis H53214]
MKKSFIVVVILIFIIIFSIVSIFNKDKKDIIKTEELNFENFDLGKMLALVEGKDVDKSKYWVENFTILLSNDKTIRSMNITVFKETVFGDRKLIMHLNRRDHELIVWDKSIRDVKEKQVRKSHYFELQRFTDLISIIRPQIIDDLKNNKSLYLDLKLGFPLSIDKTQSAYLVNIEDKKIFNISDKVDGKRIEAIKSDNKIKRYKLNNFKVIRVFGSPDEYKLYCLDEVEMGF